jgi:hypothetical protein
MKEEHVVGCGAPDVNVHKAEAFPGKLIVNETAPVEGNVSVGTDEIWTELGPSTPIPPVLEADDDETFPGGPGDGVTGLLLEEGGSRAEEEADEDSPEDNRAEEDCPTDKRADEDCLEDNRADEDCPADNGADEDGPGDNEVDLLPADWPGAEEETKDVRETAEVVGMLDGTGLPDTDEFDKPGAIPVL